jgi:hypothetical protein
MRRGEFQTFIEKALAFVSRRHYLPPGTGETFMVNQFWRSHVLSAIAENCAHLQIDLRIPVDIASNLRIRKRRGACIVYIDHKERAVFPVNGSHRAAATGSDFTLC